MATGDLSRLKQQMLRQAVQQNVEIREGGPPKSLRVTRRRVKRSVRIAAMVVVPLVLFASLNAISTGASKQEVIVLGSEAERGAAGPSAPAAFPRREDVSPSLFRLGVRTVVLDAGHGGADPGARTAAGLTEKEVTLDVALRLKELLESGGFKVLMTRAGDESVSLRDRAEFANGWRADLFVSIHVNSMPSSPKRGVETYYVGVSDDPEIKALAGEENRTSGYSLSDFRRLLEGVYRDVRQGESRKLAESVQQNLYGSLRKGNAELQNRGVKTAPFVVLIATEMPGILAEVSCVSNDKEAHLLADSVYRQNIARALFAGVAGYAESRNRGNSDKGS